MPDPVAPLPRSVEGLLVVTPIDVDGAGVGVAGAVATAVGVGVDAAACTVTVPCMFSGWIVHS